MARKGSISRIVSRLSPGAGVVTTRGDVHYVVTEYGVAYLHGKTIQERALALVSIAHPDYREQLLRDAIELKYIRQELQEVTGKVRVGPPELHTTHVMSDGLQIHFRSIRPTDEELIKDLFYDLSQTTIYYRFMRNLKRIPLKQIQDFVYIDHRTEVAIVATVPEAHGDEIIAVGRYYLNPQTNRAEVAFVVRDKWQNRGIGTALLRVLVSEAKRNGIAGFTAEVLHANRAMQSVFNKSGCKVKSELNGEVFHYDMDFS
jgi:GNAT superfamily N-acetyltransferase